jgi:heme-degrading monooxygenase HmoA
MLITQIDAIRADEAIALYVNTVVPLVKEQPGGVGAYLLVDRATGKGISIAIYDSEEAAVAFGASEQFQQTVSQFAQFFTAPPSEREMLEVYGGV